MSKYKVGEKVKWKSTEKFPFSWQDKAKVTATGRIYSIVEEANYPYLVTSSEHRDKRELFMAREEDIEKLVLSLENK